MTEMFRKFVFERQIFILFHDINEKKTTSFRMKWSEEIEDFYPFILLILLL
jgi:hypothetical protein